jgi:RNA polymerase sigma-70 factor, ECF subfamily
MIVEQPISQPIPWPRTQASNSSDALVSPHLPLLSRWVRSRVPDGEDADDIVQQTLLLAIRHIHQFRHEASFGTWLCRIAINVIRARMRSPDRRRTVFADPRTFEAFNLSDARQSPLAALEAKESKRRIHQAIARLPEAYRVVVELRDLRGFSIQEAADCLRLSKPAIKSRHFRARTLLLKHYRELQGGPSAQRLQ